MQVELSFANVITGQDSVYGAQVALARLVDRASSAQAHLKLIPYPLIELHALHQDVFTGRFRNEYDKCKFRRHR